MNDVTNDDFDNASPSSGDSADNRTRRWLPQTSDEIAVTLRKLALSPWLVAGRDDAVIGAVRRNLAAIKETFSRLGWLLIVERDFVRVRKSPPVRREAWAGEGPTPLQASWFFLIVAAAEGMAPRIGLAQIVTAARLAAAEAGLSVTNDVTERRAIVYALKMLDQRGIVMEMDGKLDGFVEDENAPVLLEVHHSRLAHTIANYAPLDPVESPELWLEHIERETDAARRMRRRLVDDTVVHVTDLDDAEADWLSKRVRKDDGGPLAEAFGLSVERRNEGAAFVLPNEAFRYPSELGPTPFPATGTVPHAALLLCSTAATSGLNAMEHGGPGPGWIGLAAADVIARITGMAREHSAWRKELTEDTERLANEVLMLLRSLNLLQTAENAAMHWFSPAIHRWTLAQPTAGKAEADRPAANLFGEVDA